MQQTQYLQFKGNIKMCRWYINLINESSAPISAKILLN